MNQIDNEKFASFLVKTRKEKDLTQKELGELLFVSDKTVSKWERGLSLPSVALLIPLAEALGTTVTELLLGEKMDAGKKMDAGEVEDLVTGSLDLSVHSSIKQKKRNWVLVFFLCLFLALGEIALLLNSAFFSMADMEGVLLISGMMLAFGGWLCLFARELLPSYYDGNRVNYYSQGIFRMHLPGLALNNGNWIYVCTTLKIWTLSTAVVFPLICFAVIQVLGIDTWSHIQNMLVFAALGGMVISTYAVGKRYE